MNGSNGQIRVPFTASAVNVYVSATLLAQKLVTFNGFRMVAGEFDWVGVAKSKLMAVY